MISTYATLLTALKEELNKSPSDSLTTEWIARAEARMNRILRVRGNTQRDTATISAEFAEPPADFLAPRSMRLADSPYTLLQFVTGEQMADLKASLQTGTTSHYALVNGEFEFFPIPSAATDVVLTYLQQVPALSVSATTNWMLTDNPDAYFRGALVEAWIYYRDAEQSALNKALFDRAIGEIRDADMRDAFAANLTPSPSSYPI